MATSTTMTQRSLTTADLKASGFQLDEVDGLVALRERYSPFREHFSEPEFQRLTFLRWRIMHDPSKAGQDKQ